MNPVNISVLIVLSTLYYGYTYGGIQPVNSSPPEDFPKDISIQCLEKCTAYPKTPEDAVKLTNWAALHPSKPRHLIPRGARHWRSLLDVDSNLTQKSDNSLESILVSTKEHLNSINLHETDPENLDSGHTVTVGAGVTLTDLLDFLASHKLGLYSAPNLGFFTIGGILASTGGHGTGIPTLFSDSSNSSSPDLSYGTLSNAVLQITIVGWNPKSEKYDLITLKKSDRDGQALMAKSIGRTLITSVTMRVIPDQVLRTTRSSLSREDLFGNCSVKDSLSSLLNKSGRITLIKEHDNDKINVLITTPVSDNDLKNQLRSEGSENSIIGPSKDHFFIPMHSNTNEKEGRSDSEPTYMTGFTVLTSREDLKIVSDFIFSNYDETLKTYKRDANCDFDKRHSELALRFTGVDDPSKFNPNPSLSLARPVSDRSDYDKVIWVEVFTSEVNPECEIQLMKKIQQLVKESGLAVVVRLADFIGSLDDKVRSYKSDFDTFKKYDPYGVFGN